MSLTVLLSIVPPQSTPTPATALVNPYLEPTAIITYIGIGIAAILAVIGIIIMYRQLHYGKKREFKELTYSILADAPLISVDTRAEREKIQIFYNKQEVKDINLILLKIWNSGTMDIKIYQQNEQTEPFETPYWFNFGDRNVIARSVLETAPPLGVIEKHDLEVYHQSPDPKPDAISLPHCLLKSKQAFTLRALLTGIGSEIKIEGKLVNCNIKEYKDSEPFTNRWFVVIMVMSYIILSLIFIYITIILSDSIFMEISFIFAMSMLLILAFYSLFSIFRRN